MFKRCLNSIFRRFIIIYINFAGDDYSKSILKVALGEKGVRSTAREFRVNVSTVSHSASFLKRLIKPM